ncbi:hypothetical protein [Subtercola vilae]|uniref:hypothetical protein n=1 Tax=Subtercola vilae TaxID=2056433 RepID=UPI00137604AD|nr:hypothetical protein [Subtercola vilae]
MPQKYPDQFAPGQGISFVVRECRAGDKLDLDELVFFDSGADPADASDLTRLPRLAGS